MKVGTDGVLLGRYASVSQESCVRVLDIGTGSGLVALMIAQRAPKAQIDAIDIDEAAAVQAQQNFQASPWSERLHAYAARLQEWKPEKKYDLIVSNPPYFNNSLKNPDKGRQIARHTDSLNYEDLLEHSVRLLGEEGQLTLILPAEKEQEMRTLAASYGLYMKRAVHVFSKTGKPAKRVIICFVRNTGKLESRNPEISTLILEDEKGHRSVAYQELMNDFYL
ncbi:MAG: methyltransferase [Paludibacteraceae bacterium]|nr:methyltransferase [Paludibacteraceae bacterium]